MPTATNGDVSLHYAVAGDGETVAFVNDVGVGAWYWGWQHAALAGPLECVVWDLRGTGRSAAPTGPYDVDTLASDLEAVLAGVGASGVTLVGAGLGGMVALAHAHRFDRTDRLVLLGTAASGDAVTDRLDALRADPDDREALHASLEGMFAADLADHQDVVSDVLDWREGDDADLPGWDAQAAAMRGFEAPPCYEVTQPALVLHGTADVVVPPDAGRSLAERLPRGEFRTVEGGHACHVEESAAVTDAIDGFLRERP